MSRELAQAIERTLISPNCADSNLEAANIVDALYRVADGLLALANSVNKLGLANADTQMGAIELLSKEVRDGLNGVVTAVSGYSGE